MDTIVKGLTAKLQQVAAAFNQELNGVRTNRPSPALVEHVVVDYMGQKLSIKQLGTVSILPPRDLQISVWDPGCAAAVAKAIQDVGSGLSASAASSTVIVKLPALTAERRAELAKLAGQIAEKAKIAVRAARDDANKKVESALNAKEISKDGRFSLRKKIQEAVDAVNRQIEENLARKVKDIEI